jgi:hypothetical protein
LKIKINTALEIKADVLAFFKLLMLSRMGRPKTVDERNLIAKEALAIFRAKRAEKAEKAGKAGKAGKHLRSVA